MIISIITVCYNSSATIQDTIASVNKQSYPDIEHVFIDGGSTDGTVEIIRNLSKRNTTIISEKDQGIYDAMNKGLQKAKGEIVTYLNSDDFYYDSDVIATVAKSFRHHDIVYGDINIVEYERTNKVVRHWKAGEKSRFGVWLGWHPPHPAFFIKKSLMKSLGGFNLRYQIAADYDLMTRSLRIGKSRYVPKLMTALRVGGVSTSGLRQIIKSNIECTISLISQGNIFALFTVCLKLVRKSFQLQ